MMHMEGGAGTGVLKTMIILLRTTAAHFQVLVLFFVCLPHPPRSSPQSWRGETEQQKSLWGYGRPGTIAKKVAVETGGGQGDS